MALALRLANQWQFTITEELPRGFCCRVFAGHDRVLRVPFQGEELVEGARAARRLALGGGPRVYEWDETSGSLLMERLFPGSTLAQAELPDNQAQNVVITLIKKLQTLPTEGCMTIGTYFGSTTPFIDHLLETSPEEQFLHGDLHHFNILRSGSDWVPIDPKGMVGDPNYEAIAFLRNPLDIMESHPDLERLLRTRLDRFEEAFGWSPYRMMGLLVADLSDLPETETVASKPWTRLLGVARKVFESLG